MNNLEIVEKLIARDGEVTQKFFFEECRPLFKSIINNVFSYEVDYDEFVSEFYIYLLENDARRLKQYEGRSSIYQWIKIVAIRYFIAKRNRLIEDRSSEPLYRKPTADEICYDEHRNDAVMDLERLFALMPNKRFVYAIRRLVLEDAEPADVAEELEVTVGNLYNIKKRAIAELTDIALKEAGQNEKDEDDAEE